MSFAVNCTCHIDVL